MEDSLSESKQKGIDRSFQRPSASNASRLLLPDNDGPLDKNEFLTTFLKPRLLTTKSSRNSVTCNNQQDRTINQINNLHDEDEDEEENNEIRITTNTRENTLTKIRNILDSTFRLD